MKIAILTVGSRGDVQPFLALAIGLMNAGHKIKFGANIEFKEFIESRNIDFYPIRDNPLNALKKENSKSSGKEKKNLYYKFMSNWIKDGLKIAENVDLLIFTPVYHVGYHIAEKLKIKSIKCSYTPFTPTKEFSNPYIKPISKYFNKLSYSIYNFIEWQLIRKNTNRIRKELLNLSPISFSGMLNKMNKDKVPLIYGISKSVLSRPNDWPEWVHLTGYWFLEDLENYSPSEDLKNFIHGNNGIIYYDIGSLGEYSKFITEKIIPVLTDMQYKIIANPGNADIKKFENKKNIFFVDGTVPHAWILPKVTAVISHGGPSTIASVFKAGKPITVIPLYGDHNYWGRKAFELGVGTIPLLPKSMNDKTIKTVVTQLMTDNKLQSNSKILGEKIRQEKGIEETIRIIEEFI